MQNTPAGSRANTPGGGGGDLGLAGDRDRDRDRANSSSSSSSQRGARKKSTAYGKYGRKKSMLVLGGGSNGDIDLAALEENNPYMAVSGGCT